MRVYIAFKIFLFSLGIFSYQNSFAWWDQPHQLIGTISGEHVSTKTHADVLKLLQQPISSPGSVELSENTNGFDTAASWADAVKESNGNHYGWCHYIPLGIDKSLIGSDIDDITAQRALNIALSENKLNSVTCLKSLIKTLMDPKQSVVQKAISVRLVIHIMGDIVQPLHNGTVIEDGIKDDNGSKTLFHSTILIPSTNGGDNPQKKLHALWDASLGNFLQFPFNPHEFKQGVFSQSDLMVNIYYSKKLQTQKNIQDTFTALYESTQNQTIEDWIIEGYRVAAKNVYTDLNETWALYSIPRHEIINKQIAKGSYRLAFLLDAIFDSVNAPIAFQNIVYNIKNDRAILPFNLK